MKTYFLWWRCVWADLAYFSMPKEGKAVIKEDVIIHRNKYIKRECGFLYALNYSLLNVQPFRSIYEYRVREGGNPIGKALIKMSNLFIPKISSVEITGGTFGGVTYST